MFLNDHRQLMHHGSYNIAIFLCPHPAPPGSQTPKKSGPEYGVTLWLCCMLFNYGIGIHLLECNSPNSSIPDKKEVINPKDNHISFQCSDMRVLMKKLEEMGIEYVTAVVEEGGIQVDQLFFHDPDGYMIEICNCENLPVLPLSSCPLKRRLENYSPLQGNPVPKARCARGMESSLMENLVADMMYISY